MDAPPTTQHVQHLLETDAVQLASSAYLAVVNRCKSPVARQAFTIAALKVVPGQCCPVGYICAGGNECKPSSTKVTITSAEGTMITNATNQPAAPATTSLVTVVAMPAIPSSSGDTGLPPKYIGAIVAGVVGFILVIALAVWIIRRQLKKLMRAVDKRLDNAAPVKDKFTESGEGAQSGPDHPELHGQPTTTEIWDGQGSVRPNPSYRWEMGGSYDAHGTSELDANEQISKAGQATALPEQGRGTQ
ncbi:hypothetical protein PG999_012220 [Apiospora kogelbergensis]|uniref:Uncharacterized protein n=1 Tax=Apiospora kogelbergensis TaxID=1337665 RepID=A0AAW0QJI1_9PEZI